MEWVMSVGDGTGKNEESEEEQTICTNHNTPQYHHQVFVPGSTLTSSLPKPTSKKVPR
jgi:hypothetical protein